MPVSGKESILNGIFRVWCVPQEVESPFVKHGKITRYDIVELLNTLDKQTRANCALTFNNRLHRGHKVFPFQATHRSQQACDRILFLFLLLAAFATN